MASNEQKLVFVAIRGENIWGNQKIFWKMERTRKFYICFCILIALYLQLQSYILLQQEGLDSGLFVNPNWRFF